MNKVWYRRAAWLVAPAILTGAIACLVYDVQAAREESSQWQETELHAHSWLGLSEEEWQRYQTWRALVGKPLAEMTPYEVLGIYTDDSEQRRRFAKENARFMLDFYRRTMEFEQLYRKELARFSDKKAP